MSNDFSALTRALFADMRTVSQDLNGYVIAANTNFDIKGASIGDTVKVPRVAASSNGDYTPAMTTTAGTDDTPSTDDVTITKNRSNSFNIKHSDRLSLRNAGNYDAWYRLKVRAAIRALLAELDDDLFTEAYQNASRAYGTAGTTPFASSLADLAQLDRILNENGCPRSDRSIVLDTAAGANVRSLTQLTDANRSGDLARLKEGILGRTLGFAFQESVNAGVHTKGTASGYLVDLLAGYAIGDRTIHLDTGTGTHEDGDIVTLAGDTNKYVINTGAAGDGDKDIVIGRPGLRAALADGVAATTGNSYTPNVAFHRNALAAAVRPPVIEPNPAMSIMTVSDLPVEQGGTGLSVTLVEIRGDGMDTVRAHLAWGVKAVSSEHIATLLG